MSADTDRLAALLREKFALHYGVTTSPDIRLATSQQDAQMILDAVGASPAGGGPTPSAAAIQAGVEAEAAAHGGLQWSRGRQHQVVGQILRAAYAVDFGASGARATGAKK